MKILIVDDHPIVRKGISSALSFEKDVEKGAFNSSGWC
jgi:DNA-binding NarL/FixJ family response regulator